MVEPDGYAREDLQGQDSTGRRRLHQSAIPEDTAADTGQNCSFG